MFHRLRESYWSRLRKIRCRHEGGISRIFPRKAINPPSLMRHQLGFMEKYIGIGLIFGELPVLDAYGQLERIVEGLGRVIERLARLDVPKPIAQIGYHGHPPLGL